MARANAKRRKIAAMVAQNLAWDAGGSLAGAAHAGGTGAGGADGCGGGADGRTGGAETAVGLECTTGIGGASRCDARQALRGSFAGVGRIRWRGPIRKSRLRVAAALCGWLLSVSVMIWRSRSGVVAGRCWRFVVSWSPDEQPQGQQTQLVGVGVDGGQFFTGGSVPSRCLHLRQDRDAVDAHRIAVDEVGRRVRGETRTASSSGRYRPRRHRACAKTPTRRRPRATANSVAHHRY